MKKGKLIVIDGSDGVGKATQTALLVKRLKKEGKKVATLDFPAYETNFFGEFVGACLRGDHGDFLHIDPYIASVLYAADRFESKAKLEKWLKDGYVVVLDRYVSANQMHQGGKIRDLKERKKFLQWLDKMEHGVFGLPRPDMIVYLHLPVLLSLVLLRGKDAAAKKKYIKGAKWDTVENDAEYLGNAQKSALAIIKSAGKGVRWERINCAGKGEILPRETIHEAVYTVVKKLTK